MTPIDATNAVPATGAGMAALLDIVPDPLVVLDAGGTVLEANRAALRLFGSGMLGRDIVGLVATPPDAVRAFLRRSSGTASPIVGALALPGPDGSTLRFRAYGARLAGGGGEVRLGLRCVPAESDELSILARKVRELDAEVGRRRATQARLEESLEANHLLLRELQHRVMNNIQLILGMFATRRREPGPPELADFLDKASGRLLAIGAVQRLMYQTQQQSRIDAATFVDRLVEAIAGALGPDVRVDVTVDDGTLSNEVAFPLALIVNELMTNAAKYAARDDGCDIALSLGRKGSEFVLTVQDRGAGITEPAEAPRSSGLALVRGLCRQIGGAFSVENADGARCTVCFIDSSNRRSDA